MPERFTLHERLGKGGMGVVWKATDTETGETVGLKLIHPVHADDPDYVEQFAREVDLAVRQVRRQWRLARGAGHRP